MFCYFKSSYFSSDSNHSFMAPSSSRIALVGAVHHQFVYFLRPLPSHNHFNLRISFVFLFFMHYFPICLRTFLLIPLSAIGSIKTLQCFMYTYSLFRQTLRMTHRHHYHCIYHNQFCYQAETFFYHRQPVDHLIQGFLPD